ncbi:hypothetical protein [Planctomycetes bacterium K23_9]
MRCIDAWDWLAIGPTETNRGVFKFRLLRHEKLVERYSSGRPKGDTEVVADDLFVFDGVAAK